MIIRLAKRNDENKISKLIAQFRVELKSFKGIKSGINIGLAKEEFREYIDANYPIYVAENNNRLLGYLVCRVENNLVWVESLFVLNNFRRKGIASKLYKEAEEISETLGGETVFNYVHPNNYKIIKFLAKMGYDVLNLIEIRKPWKDEILNKEIRILDNLYRY
ncbi:GNAT family N-acetyltransferase [Clostridium perfringens]|uniref:GNAT family N-acetyltransferase n=1 Tax=Clostridium perfringens TaxID=1502 RepID=UPI001A2CAA51|nr:GNAT family N-acetyltransferase [Clostridium perfringens]HAT4334494.1 GNAT family N-acetyltransferase [Clostridium perfringens]HAT4340977.1 GNAT family N-acetyltransferase [Clostridium perfringens]HAT4347270.1 GNAT family N-acetyltransferase [Clostridium perfringens]